MKTFTWIAISMLLAFTTRFLLIGIYKVPSYSMNPALQAGDYILVSKMAYGVRFPWSMDRGWLATTPKRGDVIVLNFKKRQTTPYVKRVIGLPGDRIQIESGRVSLNGKACEYTKPETAADGIYLENCQDVIYPVELPLTQSSSEDVIDIVVPRNQIFALNDARENHEDSRSLDSVQIDQIAGKVKYIFYSYGSTQDSISENKSVRWNRILTTP